MNKDSKVFCLIMAGGKGIRFWPKSRTKNPKQVQNFFFKNSLLKETINRINFTKNITVACSDSIKNVVKKIHPNLIVEPASRNTAPCITYASLYLQNNSEDIMVVLPSDQYIKENDKFNKIINKAINFVKKNKYIVSIGIKANTPHTGYGYIKVGKKLDSNFTIIDSFKEKPDINTAKTYFKNNYLWNAGIFVFKINDYLESVKEHMPKLYKDTKKIIENDKKYFLENFPKLQSQSIDYGIMEKIKNKACIKANFYWDDLGSWESIEKYYKNYSFGKANTKLVKNISSENIFINQFNEKKLTAIIGLKDISIIDTPDALLVVNKKNSNQIKDLVNKLNNDEIFKKYT